MSIEELDTSDSGPIPMYHDSTQMGLARLERKVDKITAILNKFVLVEERQLNQKTELIELTTRLDRLSERLEHADRKIDKWVNFGIGGWAVLTTSWAVFTLFFK